MSRRTMEYETFIIYKKESGYAIETNSPHKEGVYGSDEKEYAFSENDRKSVIKKVEEFLSEKKD